MLLTLEVGARVKLAPGHDHKLVPGYSLVSENITQAQRDKLNTAGPKYGAVVRLCPEKCAYEVSKHLNRELYNYFSQDSDVRSAHPGGSLVAGCSSKRKWLNLI